MVFKTTRLFCLIFAICCFASFAFKNNVWAQDNQINTVSQIDLDQGEFSAFDFYVGGNYYGLAYGYFTDDWFVFDNISDVIQIIPLDIPGEDLAPLLSGKIYQEKSIDGIGDIYVDSATFEIEVEFEQALGPTRDVAELNALPPPETGFAIRNEFTGAGSATTQSGFDSENLTLSHNTLFNLGRTNFISNGSLSSAAGYEITDAALSQEFFAYNQDVIGSLGLLETQGQRFSRSIDFFGFNLRTNERLFFRDEQNQATRLEIFLQSRSQVEVFRDSQATGRTLFSRLLDFGTVVIDTRNFPQGAYDVEIVITDINGDVTSEIRPFSKTNTLTPLGPPEINISAGIVRDDIDSTGQGVLFGSYRKRVFDTLEVSASALAIEDDILFEAQASSERPFSIFGFKGLLQNRLTIGIDDKADLTGVETSTLFQGEKTSFFAAASRTFDQGINSGSGISPTGGISPFLSARDAINFNFSTPVSILRRPARLNLNGEWSDIPTSGTRFRVGPQVTIPVYKTQKTTSEFRIQHTFTDDDQQTLASLTWRQNNGALQKNASIDFRSLDTETATAFNTGLSFFGASSPYENWLKNTEAFFGLRLDPVISNVNDTVAVLDSEVEYTGKFARVSAFLNNDFRQNTGRYGGELQSTFLWSPKSGLSASGENLSAENAYINVNLSGVDNARVGLAIDGSPKAFGQAGQNILLEIPIYKTVELSIFATEEGTVNFENKAYNVTGYPGNILYRDFKILKSIFIIGQFVHPDGQAIINKRFKEGKDVYYTDDVGAFYIEYLLKDDGQVTFDLGDKQCVITLPNDIAEVEDVIFEAGNVLCE